MTNANPAYGYPDPTDSEPTSDAGPGYHAGSGRAGRVPGQRAEPTGGWSSSTGRDTEGWGTPASTDTSRWDSSPARAWEDPPAQDDDGWPAADPDTGGWAATPRERDTGGWITTRSGSTGGWSSSTYERDTGGWPTPAPERDTGGWATQSTYGSAQRETAGRADGRFFDAAYPAGQELQRYPRYGISDVESPRGKDMVAARSASWREEAIEGRAVAGYLSAALAALAWYAVPLALYLVWVLFFREAPANTCADAVDACVPAKSGGLLSQMVSGLPHTLLALVMSAAIAPLLRWANQAWRNITVGFLAAIIGGGLATVIFALMSGG